MEEDGVSPSPAAMSRFPEIANIPPNRKALREATVEAAVRQKIVAGLEEKLRTDPKSLVANKGATAATPRPEEKGWRSTTPE